MSIRKNPTGHTPQISSEAYIDKSALIFGHVIIERGVFVGPYAVIRADEVDDDGQLEPIVIKNNSNIQDAVIIHCKGGSGVEIGEGSSIAHRAIVHGPCTIGNDVFIGFNTIVFNSIVGDSCVIEHSVVIDGLDIPSHSHIPSASNIGMDFDLNSLQSVSPEQSRFSASVVDANKFLVKGYKALKGEEA